MTTAVVPVGLPVEKDEKAWVERSLYPLLNSSEPNVGYMLVEATESQWGGVFRRAELSEARRNFAHLPLRQSAEAAGIRMRKPKIEEYPFQFDNRLTMAEQMQREGNWIRAAEIYEGLGMRFGNEFWMQARQANALFYAGRYEAAIERIETVNQVRPTVSSLLLEGRASAGRKDYPRALVLYQQADSILEGQEDRIRKPIHQRKKSWMEPAGCGSVSSQQESCPWT